MRASVHTRRTASLNATQVPRFHDAVAESSEGDEQRTRKPPERRVRALDKDAVVTGNGGKRTMSFDGRRDTTGERHTAMQSTCRTRNGAAGVHKTLRLWVFRC